MKKFFLFTIIFIVLFSNKVFCNISREMDDTVSDVYLNGIIFDDLSHEVKFSQDEKFYYFDVTQNIGKQNPNVETHCGALGMWIDENSSAADIEKYKQQNFTSFNWSLPGAPFDIKSSSYIGNLFTSRKADVMLSNFTNMQNIHIFVTHTSDGEMAEHFQIGTSEDSVYIFKKKVYHSMPQREYWIANKTFYAFSQVYTNKTDDEAFGENKDRVPLISDFSSDIVSVKGHFGGNYYVYDEIKYKLHYKIRIMKEDIDLFKYCMPVSPKCFKNLDDSRWYASSVSSVIDLKNIVNSHTCNFQYSDVTRTKHKRACVGCGLTYNENHNFEKEYDGIANDWCLCGEKNKINLIINDNIGKLNKKVLIEPGSTLENITFENVGYTFKDIKDVVVNESKTKTTSYITSLPNIAPNLSHTYTINYNIHSYVIKYNKTNNLNLSITQNMLSKRVYYDEKTNLDKNKYEILGYTFKGWSIDNSTWAIVYNDENEIKNVSSVDEYVLNLYPVFSVNKYTIKYHKENNKNLLFDIDMGIKQVEYNEKVNLDNNLYLKEGYTFLGWNTIKNANDILYSNEQEIYNLSNIDGATIDLFPIFKTNCYKIIYNKSNMYNINFISNMESKIVLYNEETKLDKCIYLTDGYTFLGWATSSESDSIIYNDENIIYNISSIDGYELNLYPIYKIHQYKIRYNTLNNKNLLFENEMEERNVFYNEKINLDKNIYEKNGYTFLGWNVNNESDNALYNDEQEIINLTSVDMAVINLYPIFRNNSYIIKYNKINNCNIEFDTNMPNKNIIFGEENKLDKCEFIKEGYTFLGWATNQENFEVVYSDEDRIFNISDIDGFIFNLYPVYKIHKYSIIYNKQNNVHKNIENDMPQKEVLYNERYNLDDCIYKITGYTFLGWTKDISGENIDYKNKDEIYNVSSIDGFILNLYPIFKTNSYKVVYNKLNSNDINIKNDMPPKDVFYNQKVKLDKCEFIEEGYTFLGWTNNITTNEIIYKDEDYIENLSEFDGYVYNIYPVYKVHKYSIVYNKDNNVNQKIKQNMQKKEVLYGEKVALDKCAYMIEGYTFLGWSNNKNEKNFVYKDMQEIQNLSPKDGDIINLYPYYSTNRYTIIYNTENSYNLKLNDRMLQKEVFYNQNTTLDKSIYNNINGYIFIGWSIKPDISKVIFSDEQKIYNISAKDGYELNLFPVFNPYVFTLQFKSTRGKGSMTNQICTYGKTENIMPNRYSYDRGVNYNGWLYKNIEVKPNNTSFFEKYINKNNQVFILNDNLSVKEVNEKSEEGTSPGGKNGGGGARIDDENNGPGVESNNENSNGDDLIKIENIYVKDNDNIEDKSEILEDDLNDKDNNITIDDENESSDKDNELDDNEKSNSMNDDFEKNEIILGSDELNNKENKQNLDENELKNSKNTMYLLATSSSIDKNNMNFMLNSSFMYGIGSVFKGIFGALMCLTMVGTLVYLIVGLFVTNLRKKCEK